MESVPRHALRSSISSTPIFNYNQLSAWYAKTFALDIA